MKKLILSTVLLAAICTAGQAQKKDDYYVKHVNFRKVLPLSRKSIWQRVLYLLRNSWRGNRWN